VTITILRKLRPGTTIIHGDCRGADKTVDSIARKRLSHKGFKIERFPVLSDEWAKKGKAAGPQRNKQMLVEGKPDLVLAFHEAIEKSKGTKNMINQALKAGLPVRLFDDKGLVRKYGPNATTRKKQNNEGRL
jgi:hypothetical protein